MRKFIIHILITLIYFSFIQISQSQELTLGLPLGHNSPVLTFDFSTDGNYIISSSYDGTKLWETFTGHFLKNIDEENSIYGCEFSPSTLVTYATSINSDKRRINLWDVNTGELVKEFKGVRSNFSPDGKSLATYSRNYDMTSLWDMSTFELKFEVEGYLLGFGNSDMLFIKDEDYKVYNTTNGELEYVIDQLSDPIRSVKFSKKGDVFVTISENNVIDYREVSSGQPMGNYKLDSEVDNIVLADDDKLIAVNFSNGDAKLFTRNKRKKNPILLQQSKVMAIAKNSDDDDIVILIKNDSLTGYNLVNKNTVYSIPGFDEGQCGFTLSSDNQYFLIMACGPNNAYAASIGAVSGFALYNVSNGKYMDSFFSNVDELRYTSISNNRKNLSNVSHTGKSQILSLSTGKLEHVLNTEYAISAQFSIDSKYLATTSDQRVIHTGTDLWNEVVMQESQWIWDVSSGELSHIIEDRITRYNELQEYDISVSRENRNVAVISKVEYGLANPFKDLIGHSDKIYYETLSPDDRMAVTASLDQTIKLWESTTGKLLHTFSGYISKVNRVQFIEDNKRLLTISDDGTQKVWDISTNRLLNSVQFQNIKNSDWNDSSNDVYRVVNDLDANILYVYRLSTNEIVHALKDHKDLITSFHFVSNTNFLISSSYDGSTIIWDLDSGKQLVRILVFDNRNPVWLLPNGYYFASKEAASKLYYTEGLKSIGFEQLDVRYNRPDKVLEVLNRITESQDSILIKAYNNAWKKRIKKLDIDTSSFSLGFSIPECDFINRDAIAYEQNNSELVLHIKGVDSTTLLDRFNIWVNEVPVYGKNGISLKHMKTQLVHRTLKIKLSKGSNKIETSVINNNGIESYRLPLYVNFTPKKDIKEKLYFVGIGVDKYQEEGHNLNYSVKDIRDLSLQLKEKYGNQIEIDTLFNQDVTVSNILELKEHLKKSKVDDKVIISYSGHGLLSEDLDYYLGTYDIDFNSPEQYGLPYDELEFLLDNIPSRKKLLFIDACHSGEVDKDEVVAISTLEKEKEGIKGAKVIVSRKGKIGLKNSFELMKELFNNVDRSTGATIISAAAGTQFAQERGDLKNGVFTYCILNQLKEKQTITVNELKDIVSKQVQEITNGLQQPTNRNETIENNWEIW